MSNFVRLPGKDRAVNMDLVLNMEVEQSGSGWQLVLYPAGDLCLSGGYFESRTDAISAMMRLAGWTGTRKEAKHGN